MFIPGEAEAGADFSRGTAGFVSTGVPHFPQNRSPMGTSALHFRHFCFNVEAQFRQIWVLSEFWKPHWGQTFMEADTF
jgi:hypothetical protein